MNITFLLADKQLKCNRVTDSISLPVWTKNCANIPMCQDPSIALKACVVFGQSVITIWNVALLACAKWSTHSRLGLLVRFMSGGFYFTSHEIKSTGIRAHLSLNYWTNILRRNSFFRCQTRYVKRGAGPRWVLWREAEWETQQSAWQCWRRSSHSISLNLAERGRLFKLAAVPRRDHRNRRCG